MERKRTLLVAVEPGSYRADMEEFEVTWITGEEVGRSTAEGWVLQSDLASAEWLKDALEDSFKSWEERSDSRVSSVGTIATFLYDSYIASPFEPWVEGESAYLDEDISKEMVKILRQHADGADECWATYWLGSDIFSQAQLQAPKLQLPYRESILYRGSFERMIAARPERDIWPVGGGWSPSAWWPANRSWLAVSDVDIDAFYIGCSKECADDLLSSGIRPMKPVSPLSPTIGNDSQASDRIRDLKEVLSDFESLWDCELVLGHDEHGDRTAEFQGRTEAGDRWIEVSDLASRKIMGGNEENALENLLIWAEMIESGPEQ